MTVALLLATAPDRLSAMTQPYRQPGDRRAGDSAAIDGVAGSGVRLARLDVRQAASTGRPGPLEDGLVAGLAAAPLAKTIARSAAARGLAPNGLTMAALALTGCAAAWFAAGTRSGL